MTCTDWKATLNLFHFRKRTYSSLSKVVCSPCKISYLLNRSVQPIKDTAQLSRCPFRLKHQLRESHKSRRLADRRVSLQCTSTPRKQQRDSVESEEGGERKGRKGAKRPSTVHNKVSCLPFPTRNINNRDIDTRVYFVANCGEGT